MKVSASGWLSSKRQSLGEDRRETAGPEVISGKPGGEPTSTEGRKSVCSETAASIVAVALVNPGRDPSAGE